MLPPDEYRAIRVRMKPSWPGADDLPVAENKGAPPSWREVSRRFSSLSLGTRDSRRPRGNDRPRWRRANDARNADSTGSRRPAQADGSVLSYS
jgi:hypothetical protein